MLFDKFVEHLYNDPSKLDAPPEQVARVRTHFVDQCRRFVFDESASLTLTEMCRDEPSVRASREGFFPPAPLTWIEFPSGVKVMTPEERAKFPAKSYDAACRVGYLYTQSIRQNSDKPVSGLTMVGEFPNGDVEIVSTYKLYPDFHTELVKVRQVKPEFKEHHSKIEIRAMAVTFVTVAFAMLNTPKAFKVSEVTISEKLNKRREKRGRSRLSDYTLLSLSRASEGHASGADDPREGVAFHPVRAHIRMLGNGQATFVKAHWRGDPTKGTVNRPVKVVE